MDPKGRAPFQRLLSLTQARKLLKRLEERKEIISYARFFNGQTDILMYRIYYTDNKFFYIKFLFPPAHVKLNGEPVSMIDKHNGDMLVFVNNDRKTVKKIYNLMKEKIASTKNGVMIENKFIEDLEEALKKNRDLRSIVKSIRKASTIEDINGIDVILTLTSGKEMPLQIKSTAARQRVHKESKFGEYISSLLYEGSFSKKTKNDILQIIEFYEKYKLIEHL